MRHAPRTIVALLAVGLVVLAAGCGGSKKLAVSVPTISIPTNPQPQTTPTTGSFASAKNCLAFASLASSIARAMSPASGSGGSSLQNSTRVLQAIAAAAPSDIKGDLQTVASAFGSYVQALQSSGYNPNQKTPPTPAEMAAIGHAAQVFSSAKFIQASHHLTAWEQQNCHS